MPETILSGVISYIYFPQNRIILRCQAIYTKPLTKSFIFLTQKLFNNIWRENKRLYLCTRFERKVCLRGENKEATHIENIGAQQKGNKE